MWVYLLKSGACMAVFLLFYKLLLEKENMHVFKRFFLLGALIASFVIPNLVFVAYIIPTAVPLVEVPLSYGTTSITVSERPTDMDTIHWSLILWSIYVLGVVGFGIRFLKHLFQIVYRIKTNAKLKQKFSIKVLLQENLPPHTFFSYIFLNQQKFETNTIPQEVLLHEETHAKQRHSLDVLFIETLQIFLWFNPFIYFFKRSIKLNHEFLADHAVLNRKGNTTTYQNTLLSYISKLNLEKHQSTGIANAINYSSIKKRFTVMKKRTSKKGIALRVFLLLPILALLVYGFAKKKTVYKEGESIILENNADVNECVNIKHVPIKLYKNEIEIAEKKFNTSIAWLDFLRETYAQDLENKNPDKLHFVLTNIDNVQNDLDEILSAFSGGVWKVHTSNNGPANTKEASIQEKATSRQIAEYNDLAKKYNAMLAKKGNIRILKSEVDRMENLYSNMSKQQKADAEPFPDFPEPPAPPAPPKTPQDFSKKEDSIVKKVKLVSPSDILSQQAGMQEVNGWTVTTSTNRGVRKLDEVTTENIGNDMDIPPVAPTIAIHANTDNYSPALKKAIQNYLKLNKDYEKSVVDYVKDNKGNNKSLWNKYNETMKSYVAYHTIATEEGNMVYPSPKFKERDIKHKDISPPAPPTPKSPLDHAIEMAKQGATFYYKGKKITSDKAIEILKENEDLSMDISSTTGQKPIVKISTYF